MKMGLRELTSQRFRNPVISILLLAMADSLPRLRRSVSILPHQNPHLYP